MITLHDLLTKSIIWQKHEINDRYFFCQFDNQLLLLRMNNFPDEPLWTLIRGKEILDIEDTLEFWYIPFS